MVAEKEQEQIRAVVDVRYPKQKEVDVANLFEGSNDNGLDSNLRSSMASYELARWHYLYGRCVGVAIE